jgi:hypothetical protein
MVKKISRRAFLTSSAVVGADIIAETQGVGLISLLMKAFSNPEYSNEFQRDGNLIIVPSQGGLYVASDFHSRHTDFKKWFSKTNLVEKLKGGEDVYGLIVGDAVDMKPKDSYAEKDGDSRIVDEIRNIQESLGENGKRLIFTQGNHESEVVKIYDALKKQYGLNSGNQKQLVEGLYRSRNGRFYQQFNFIERMTDEQFEYLKQLPVAVLTKNGIVGVHAAPSRIAKSTKDIAQTNDQNKEEILWNRPGQIKRDGYNFGDVRDFLKVMEGSGLLVTGHTPLSYLPSDYVQGDVGIYGNHQIILATSYGSEPGRKSYLALDLGKRFENVGDLQVGREIQRLDDKLTMGLGQNYMAE